MLEYTKHKDVLLSDLLTVNYGFLYHIVKFGNVYVPVHSYRSKLLKIHISNLVFQGFTQLLDINSANIDEYFSYIPHYLFFAIYL